MGHGTEPGAGTNTFCRILPKRDLLRMRLVYGGMETAMSLTVFEAWESQIMLRM